jgi:hypothetical protein
VQSTLTRHFFKKTRLHLLLLQPPALQLRNPRTLLVRDSLLTPRSKKLKHLCCFVVRPVAQLAHSHPRLVTTKLTATIQAPTTTGPGWSRPASVAPSPPNGAQPIPGGARPPSTGNPPSKGLGTSLPQSRPPSNDHSNGVPSTSNKPVWGNVKAPVGSGRSNTRVENDFPTAAEVAHGILPPFQIDEIHNTLRCFDNQEPLLRNRPNLTNT